MKRVVASLVFVFLFSCIKSHSDSYAAYARVWVERHRLLDRSCVPDNDLQAVIDLIAISYQRSALTLRVQKAGFEFLTLAWQSWQNITQTRLNPSKERPYSIETSDAIAQSRVFFDLLAQHASMCAEYGKKVQEIVYGDRLKSVFAKDAVADMRAQARVYMLDALTDVKEQLGGLYDIAFKRSQGDCDARHADEMIVRSDCFGLGDFLMSYIPQLVVHSFIHADKTHILLSEQGWELLDKMQCIGNQVWRSIEQTRIECYEALMNECLKNVCE